MKTALTITGYICLSLIIMGSLFKIMHWPGAGPMIVLGNIVFAFAFLTIFLIYRIRNKNNSLDVISSIAMTITLWFLSIGTMFKLMHWPGGGPMLVIGLTLFATAFLPVALVDFYKKTYRDGLGVIGSIIAIAGLCMVMAMNVSKNVLNSFVINEEMSSLSNQHLLEINHSFYDNIKPLLRQEDMEKVLAIQRLSVDMQEFINKYKLHLMKHTDGLTAKWPEKQLSLRMINGIDNYDIPTQILIGEPASPSRGEWSALLLKQEIINYRDALMTHVESDQAKNKLRKVLELKDHGESNGIYETWEVGFFYFNTLASVINTLTVLQNTSLIAESIALNALLTDKEDKSKAPSRVKIAQ